MLSLDWTFMYGLPPTELDRTYGEGNGCATPAEMQARLEAIRERIRYAPGPDSGLSGMR